MNRLILSLLIMIFAVSCHSGDESSTALLPVKSEGAYGYINRKGKVAIPFRYTRAGCFSGGVAVVASGTPRVWGYLDSRGKYVIQPIYSYATSFSEGIAFVVKEGGAPIAIDKNGVQLFELRDAQTVENFSDGFAAYSVLGPSGEVWGFVDRSGNASILPQFSAASYFSGGLCGVMNGDGNWGYINSSGEVVIDYLYDNVHPFVNGSAKIMLRGKWGVIDKKGRSIVPPVYDDVDLDGDLFLVKDGDKWGWIDADEKQIIPTRFADAYPFNGSSMAPVRLNKKWGYINGYGKFVIPATYDFAFGFEDGLGLVEVNGKYGFIDPAGNYVVKPQYEHVPVDYFIMYFANTTSYYCVKTDINSPVAVAYKWLNGFYHLDYFEANKYATRDTRQLLQQFAHIGEIIPDSSRQRMMGVLIGIKDCVERGNRAIVTYTLSDNRGKEQQLYLTKRMDKWLVQFSPEGMTENNE